MDQADRGLVRYRATNRQHDRLNPDIRFVCPWTKLIEVSFVIGQQAVNTPAKIRRANEISVRPGTTVINIVSLCCYEIIVLIIAVNQIGQQAVNTPAKIRRANEISVRPGTTVINIVSLCCYEIIVLIIAVNQIIELTANNVFDIGYMAFIGAISKYCTITVMAENRVIVSVTFFSCTKIDINAFSAPIRIYFISDRITAPLLSWLSILCSLLAA